MRIHLKLTPNQEPVPYDHLQYLVGAIHKWFGPNNLHDSESLYSFSWLVGGKGNGSGLHFQKGASFFISSFSDDIIRQLVRGIQDDPSINFGLEVREIILQETPEFGDEAYFKVACPVLAKRKIGEEEKHFVFTDPQVDDLLTQTLQTKLRKAGLIGDGVQVRFDKSYPLAKVKKVNYRHIGNKASLCPVIVKGTPEQIAFAWNVGIGNSTGIGFGALL
ncbi:CRISPR-associated endoribonuclease Cas6 [Spirosoma sp. 209]|uniref:CRISPR-associated endoribonuclease Cas6 n=1 Tax=Spirosoma sp. 209 TaxID=1955701 RepID=UPI00098D3AAE|nr:CRISPR-associated endoribonuclease Cas6 [Spirosoma sp. 209]PHK08547.1 CRISPR-associated protein Cas6 [Nostoc linckia z14]PHK29021.1 CRISPR-associated protein Cas6 [Nostoc linckia z16]